MRARVDYNAYLRSKEWQVRRRYFIDRALGRCQLCDAAGQLHLHHRTYERLGSELDVDVIVLCDACHEHHHFGREVDEFFAFWHALVPGEPLDGAKDRRLVASLIRREGSLAAAKDAAFMNVSAARKMREQEVATR